MGTLWSNRKLWLTPIAVLAILAAICFIGFWVLDNYVTGGPIDNGDQGATSRYWHYDADHITDATSALAGLCAAELALVITVVSIIVQLSSDRYSGVAQMFLRDKVNIGVLAYFVVACVMGVWLSMSIKADFVPRLSLTAMITFDSLGLIMMLPYFAYVFRFLEPTAIITRIRAQALDSVSQRDQAAALNAMEELTDITSNSISGKDKIIASAAVDALKDFAVDYLPLKRKAGDAWFEIGESIRHNPTSSRWIRNRCATSRPAAPGSSGRSCASTSASTTRRSP